MMSAPHAEQIVDGYLARLDQELSEVAAPQRSELRAQIEAHISEARAALTDETDADLLNIVDRLGSPEEVVHDLRTSTTGEAEKAPAKARVASQRGRLVLAGAVLAWGGGLASAIGAVVLFLQSDFPEAAVTFTFAGVLGIAGGMVVFRRLTLAVACLVLAATAAARNEIDAWALPFGISQIATATLILFIAAAALTGVARVMPAGDSGGRP
jgi:uncharacterized membrane protein